MSPRLETPAQTAPAGEKAKANPSRPSPSLLRNGLDPRIAHERSAAAHKARGYDPRVDCGATTKRAHTPCKQPKGIRTQHPGVGRCWLHNGRRQTAGSLQREVAENALAHLDLPPSQDPVEALLEALRVASWRELALRRMVAERPSLFGNDHLGDAREDVVSAMHDRALKRRAEVAKMAVDAGIDERMVRLAERQSEVVVRAIQAALDAAGLEGDARELAEAAAATVLEASTPEGVALN